MYTVYCLYQSGVSIQILYLRSTSTKNVKYSISESIVIKILLKQKAFQINVFQVSKVEVLVLQMASVTDILPHY